jgi:hypothetical protein
MTERNQLSGLAVVRSGGRTVGLSLRTSHSDNVTSARLTNADGPIFHGDSDVRNIHHSADGHRSA